MTTRAPHAGAALLMICAATVAACGGASSAKWTSQVAYHIPINPADLRVFVKVTNTGTESGRPSCTVDASDPSGAYHGVDVFDGTTQKPGQSVTYHGDLVITSEGADFVTKVTAKCETA